MKITLKNYNNTKLFPKQKTAFELNDSGLGVHQKRVIEALKKGFLVSSGDDYSFESWRCTMVQEGRKMPLERKVFASVLKRGLIEPFFRSENGSEFENYWRLVSIPVREVDTSLNPIKISAINRILAEGMVAEQKAKNATAWYSKITSCLGTHTVERNERNLAQCLFSGEYNKVIVDISRERQVLLPVIPLIHDREIAAYLIARAGNLEKKILRRHFGV